MKKILGLVLCGTIWISCQENETTNEFTGNETVYALQQGSAYTVSGIVTIKERRDGASTVIVSLTGTTGATKLPAHLHLGDISTPGADVAALLSPVDASTGVSETRIAQLADETTVSYADLIAIEACIKIHLADTGPGRDIILAGGNIGESVNKPSGSGRIGIGICKSE